MAKRIIKNSKNIQLLVADTLSAANNIELTALIALLPSNFQERAKRYMNKRSSVNYCFGRLMLNHAIEKLGFEKEKLNQLYFSENNKPLIDDFSFSISHSEHIVALAFSMDFQLGLDIENLKKVDLKNFHSFFRKDEWETINSAKNPLQKFYWYWVRKESILKAVDGKLNQVNDIFITSPDSGFFQKMENSYHLIEIEIAKNFTGVIATDKSDFELHINPFSINN